LNGIAVVRNGFMVGERVYGYSPPSLFVFNSATKSVLSMLVRIALGQTRGLGHDGHCVSLMLGPALMSSNCSGSGQYGTSHRPSAR
jgi:hypothetical protein